MSGENPRGRRPYPLSEARATAPARSREMGQWSFLTWSFFLSQVLSAEQFLGSAAAANEPSPEAASRNDVPGDPAGINPGSTSAGGSGNHGDASGGTPVAVLGSHLGDVPLLNLGGVLGSVSGGLGPLGHVGSIIADGGQPVVLAGGILGSASTDAVHSHDATQHDGDGGLASSPIGLGLGDLGIGNVLSPVLGLVGDVTGMLPPVAATLDSTLQTVGGVVDVAGDVVQTLTTTLSNVTGSLPGPLGAVLPQATGVIAGEAAGITTVVHSAVDLLHDALGGANGNSLLSGIAGSIGQNALASGGTLSFPSLSTGVHNTFDALFSPSGGYTDYNLSLQNTGLGTGGTAPVSSGASNLLTTLLDHVTLDTHADGATHAPTSGFSLPGALDELHLRGLGDGIAA